MINDHIRPALKLWTNPAVVVAGMKFLETPMTAAEIIDATEINTMIESWSQDQRPPSPPAWTEIHASQDRPAINAAALKHWKDPAVIAACHALLACDSSADEVEPDWRLLEIGYSVDECWRMMPGRRPWCGDVQQFANQTLIVGDAGTLLFLALIGRLDALLAFKQVVIVDELVYEASQRYADAMPFGDTDRLQRWIDDQVRAGCVLCPTTWFGTLMAEVRCDAGDDEVEQVVARHAMRKLVEPWEFSSLATIEHLGDAIASIDGAMLYLGQDVDALSANDRHQLEVARELELLLLLGISRWLPEDSDDVPGEEDLE